MEKIYVKFGEIHKNETYISVYEAIFENNVIKIIMPTTLYTTCQSIARQIDYPAYVVTGTVSGKGKDGEPLLINWKILTHLTFNKTLENYTPDHSIPHPREKRGNPNLPKWYQK